MAYSIFAREHTESDWRYIESWSDLERADAHRKQLQRKDPQRTYVVRTLVSEEKCLGH